MIPESARAPVFVSTGSLPPPPSVRAMVAESCRLARGVGGGTVSTVYPALARAHPDLLGVAVSSVDGQVYTAGDARLPFTIMSVAKPFVFALACRAVGTATAVERIGVNATGLAFDSAAAVRRGPGGRTNPMVNPGAIVATGLIPGATFESRWCALQEGLSAFAGRDLVLDEAVHRSATASNHHNRALGRLLHEIGVLECDPEEAVELYTRQSCLAVTATDIALMGATLADGGVQPRTGELVVPPAACRAALAAMTTAGLYEVSGEWLHDIGLPGKSGIGGGMVTVAPGKGALGTFAPPLDGAGNSVRGRVVAEFLSRTLGLDLFASRPV
ncbi:glutaminase A [Pseudonocardia lacus]|uniref:glutaminase A n=1 Tax=Pseudonocardia lacus TaxID=2835865 RepID=UPI001BDCBFD4|nr:glutaminase A [Pseudonocardia lacus]